MHARIFAAFLIVLVPCLGLAQGFAGLGTDAEGYEQVVPDRALSFPRDHAAHPGYRIEWWYLTANLLGDDGTEYGIQYTVFRQAGAPPPEREGWASQQFWLGHIALTTPDRHLYAERIARGGVGQAGAEAKPFSVWIDNWRLASNEDGAETALGFGALQLAARDDAFAYDLSLTTTSPPVLQGRSGYSVKSDRGQASYYYSQPYFEADGSIVIDGKSIPVTGVAWLDREWSSQPLAADQSGWDWFSLHLGETTKLMLFRLRHDDGEHYVSGNWIEGRTSTPISAEDIRMEILAETALADRTLPTSWRIAVPSRDVDVSTTPLNPMAWNGTQIGYWEGPIKGTGSHKAIGYLEMTGY